jgi:hypothetical protein
MLIETAVAFVSEECSICDKAKDLLVKDFMKYDISLIFIEKDSSDSIATTLGIIFFPAFYVAGVIFYSMYGKDQVDQAVKAIKGKN